MTKPLDLAEKYMRSFFGMEPLAEMRAILAEDLLFEGPFLKSFTAKEYLDSLHENPPEDVSYVVEEAYEDENSACLVYWFSKPGVDTRMAQTFEIRDGKIHKIKLVFDTEAFK
ncbi:MAG: nuclear transport factor 2 family protein [Candidatus Thiodiazotropha sp.]